MTEGKKINSPVAFLFSKTFLNALLLNCIVQLYLGNCSQSWYKLYKYLRKY